MVQKPQKPAILEFFVADNELVIGAFFLTAIATWSAGATGAGRDFHTQREKNRDEELLDCNFMKRGRGSPCHPPLPLQLFTRMEAHLGCCAFPSIWRSRR